MQASGSRADNQRSEFYDTFSSPIGTLHLKFEGRALTGVSFERPPVRAGAAPASFLSELDGYFAGRLRGFAQKVSFTSGTEFEKRVWRAIMEIPYGQTRTYKWVAKRVGSPMASRAVGQALSKNPIPIVVPCHRVVESHGDIGGYSSGKNVKRRLLSLEYYHSAGAD